MKFILFAFNFVFVIIGATLVSMGVYLLVKSRDFDQIIETPDAAAVLVVIVGAVTFVIAFLGCCGASQESSCMLTSYAIIVGLVFLLEVAGAILLLVYTGQITQIARQGVETAVDKYDPKQNSTSAPVNGFVDILQWSLQCCGSEGPMDYSTKGKFTAGKTPLSCCFDPLADSDEPQTTCSDGGSNGSKASFKQGCAQALDDFLHLFVGIIAGILIFAGAIKIIAACFACSLRNAVM
jgi:CD63 antigen